MSETITTTARLAPGEQYSAGRYRAKAQPDGSLLLAMGASGRRRYVTLAEAKEAAGVTRDCKSARAKLKSMIDTAHAEARRDVESILGAPYDETLPVHVSCGEVQTALGVVLAIVDGFEPA